MFYARLFAAERITIELRPGEGVTCAVLTIPKPWTPPPYNPTDGIPGLVDGRFESGGARFEFRMSQRLVLRVYSPGSLYPRVSHTPLYSLEQYAVVLEKGKLALASASAEEWESARVLPQSKRNAAVNGGEGGAFSYAGNTFVPSGKYWWVAPDASTFLSADVAYMAALSWDGTISLPDPFGVLQSERLDGHYFIDLHDLKTGRKIAQIRGKFHDVTPGFATLSSWIEGPRYILPVSSDLRRLVLCEVQ